MTALVARQTLLQARASGKDWIAELAKSLGCGEGEITQAIGQHCSMRTATLQQLRRWTPDFRSIDLLQCQARQCLLMTIVDEDADESVNGSLHAAVVIDPWDDELLAWLDSKSPFPVELILAPPAELRALLTAEEAKARATDSIRSHSEIASSPTPAPESLTLASASKADSPAVQLVSSALYDALKLGASDVHLESTRDGLAVKYRIDGVLEPVMQAYGVALAEQVISRLKVLAELDIAERRVPQDGGFRVAVQERAIDLRLSVMPSVHGEDAVVRVLDKEAMVQEHGRLTLDALGLNAATVGTLRSLVRAAYGMVLVTGPTGSGKTTTLYAALSEIHNGRDKIVTIEDPVEYQIPGILQIPVNDRKGLTFARGLRSILRHDPDRIMVGEIRDQETAEIAVQSALTGHLVLTTIHANSAYDVFSRFMHMGLDPYAFASALNGIWAQRLVRINCPECAQATAPSEGVLARCGLSRSQIASWSIKAGRGCGACRGTGYRGRRAVAEVMRMNDELRELVVTRQPVKSIREVARAAGTMSLFDAALNLVSVGQTTFEEVQRVTVAG
jgi:general secretion pathway protein E